MTINIEKMRFDIAEKQRQAEINQRWENRRFTLQIVGGFAATVVATVAMVGLLRHLFGYG